MDLISHEFRIAQMSDHCLKLLPTCRALTLGHEAVHQFVLVLKEEVLVD